MRFLVLIIACSSFILLTNCGKRLDQILHPIETLSDIPTGYHGNKDKLIMKPGGMHQVKAEDPRFVPKQPKGWKVVKGRRPVAPSIVSHVRREQIKTEDLYPVTSQTRANNGGRQSLRALPNTRVTSKDPWPSLSLEDRSEDLSFKWRTIENYQAGDRRTQPLRRNARISVPIVEGGVTVFPVEGDEAPYTPYTYNYLGSIEAREPLFVETEDPVRTVDPIALDRQIAAHGTQKPRRIIQQQDLSSKSSRSKKMPAVMGRDPAKEVFFRYGSDKIPGKDRKDINNMVRNLNSKTKQGDYDIRVIGHASKPVYNVKDPKKRRMINFEMAQKRAAAVSRTLYEAGARPSWVMVMSKGDEVPNPKPRGKKQEVADRRAEIFIDTDVKRR